MFNIIFFFIGVYLFVKLISSISRGLEAGRMRPGYRERKEKRRKKCIDELFF
jgi:hypothetical protein